MGKKYLLIIFILFLLNFVGCSLIGYGAGTAATGNREFNSKTQKFAVIDSSETIIVSTRNGETIECEFINFSKRPFDEYADTYERIRIQLKDSISLPKIGDEIFCKGIPIYYQIKGSPYTQRIFSDTTMIFYGFDFGKILLSENTNVDLIHIPISSLEDLYKQEGNNFDFNKLPSLMSNGALPLISNLNINTKDELLSFKGEEIEKIGLGNISYSGIGFLTGLVIDGIIFYSLINDFNVAPKFSRFP